MNPKIDTPNNYFRLHDCKFKNTSNSLASKLTSDNNIQRLREIFAQLQTIAAKLEEIFEQVSAFMTLDDLELFLQKSAELSLFLLHYADKLAFMIGSTFSKHLFTITDQSHKLTESPTCKTQFPERRKTSSEVTLVALLSTTSR